MLKRYVGLVVAAAFFVFQLFGGSAYGLELDDATRTVPLNDQGDTITLTRTQAEEGARLFGKVCASCHALGVTKTNPAFDLSTETLSLANPRRDTVEGLVDYMKDPTTYDGEISIAEIHPSKKSADIYPAMRNLTEDNLSNIAGHILIQPKVMGDKWGGGKIYF
ncbi:photosystem II cytochrome c-550 [Lyngbya confervoides]|uniref:Photosystem II extrinsic protein V n=1 Tax=Lyngbya confervoides BDU141951 TaxID=1574623 RepID=A0ABD4T3J7_9CYAN|nr:photosystem II cytochrome c-550 [Lyngbya confervoides]MCM1983180.1 photosystem II cytochrome c-550 [Lyngbya confervoides BDU141951]